MENPRKRGVVMPNPLAGSRNTHNVTALWPAELAAEHATPIASASVPTLDTMSTAARAPTCLPRPADGDRWCEDRWRG
jgi:hypothetical protein